MNAISSRSIRAIVAALIFAFLTFSGIVGFRERQRMLNARFDAVPVALVSTQVTR